jgi:hypothetical protein
MSDESTHFILQDGAAIISPDLQQIITFLQEIDKEVQSFQNFEKRLVSIQKQHLESIELIQVLAGKLKEHSIDFKFTFSEHPETIAEKLRLHRPIRSEVIVLFANLETLLCLDIAYSLKTSNKREIIQKAMDSETVKGFLENFCLSTDNEWAKKNPERIKHISAGDLRDLRNSLTHFFSVSKGLGIAHSLLDAKSRKLEEATAFKARFLSPEDLYEILKGAARLMMLKWNNDCRKSMANNSTEFKERILCARDVVNDHGVQVVMNNQINI